MRNRPNPPSTAATCMAVSSRKTTFLYDGDGNRVKKTDGGQTVLYVNRFYEQNLTTGNATTYYYFGGKLVAMSENATLRYVHQDHLTGTSLMTDSSGALVSSINYLPFRTASAEGEVS